MKIRYKILSVKGGKCSAFSLLFHHYKSVSFLTKILGVTKEVRKRSKKMWY